MRGGVRAFLPDLAPCARCARGVVSEGPARVASRRPLAKGTPYGIPLQGASRIARTRGQHSHERRARSARPRPAPGAAPTDQLAARAARRAVARQPDQGQRRLPRELRRRPTRSTPRTQSSACARSASTSRPPNLAIAYLKTQDRRRDPARRPGLAGRAGRTTSWRRSPTRQDPRHFGGTAAKNNLVAPPARNAAHEGYRQGAVRRVRIRPSTARSARDSRWPRSRRSNVPATDRACRPAIAWLTKQQCANGLWQAYRREHRPLRARPPTRRPSADPTRTARRSRVAGPRGVGQVPAPAPRVLNVVEGRAVERRRLPVHRRAGSGVGSRLDRARDPGAHRREQRRRPRRCGRRARARRTRRWRATSSVAPTPASAPSSSRATPLANVFATVQSVPAMAGKKLPVPLVDDVGDRSR